MDAFDRIFISFMFFLTLLFITIETRSIKEDLTQDISTLVCERPIVIEKLRGEK